ncbi:MAG: hypothetical protein WBJ13_13650 [Sedimentibacter sp.]
MDVSLKNILLAGIGSMAYSYEKSADIIKNLIEKGEITVNQGMELNEELKRKKNSEKNTNESGYTITLEKLKEMMSSLNIATEEDIKGLENRIRILEEK